MRHFIIFVLGVALVSCTASSESEFTPQDTWPDMSTLQDNFRQEDTAIVVYAKEDYAIADVLVNGMAAMKQPSERFKVVLRRDDELTEYEVQHFPLYIIGTREHLTMRRLSGNIPVEFATGSFTFNNTTYNAPNDLIKLSFYPNVFNPQMPLTVIFGNHEEVVVEFIQQELQGEWGYFFWDAWGYQVFQNGHRSMVGNFSQEEPNRWQVSEDQLWAFDYTGKEVAKSGLVHYYAHNGLESAQLTAYDAQIQNNLRAVEAFCNKALPTDITIHLFPDAETKTMQLDNADQTIIDYKEHTLYTVIDEEYTGWYD